MSEKSLKGKKSYHRAPVTSLSWQQLDGERANVAAVRDSLKVAWRDS
jgi:hypothetical protein